MRRCVVSGILVVFLTFTPARDGVTHVPNDRANLGSRIVKVLRDVVRHFVPTKTGDLLSPPRP